MPAGISAEAVLARVHKVYAMLQQDKCEYAKVEAEGKKAEQEDQPVTLQMMIRTIGLATANMLHADELAGLLNLLPEELRPKAMKGQVLPTLTLEDASVGSAFSKSVAEQKTQ